MHRYQLGVKHWFGTESTFDVEAENREEAREKGLKHHLLWGGNYDPSTLRVIKQRKR